MSASATVVVAAMLWASSPFGNIERVSPEAAAQNVSQCGVGPVSVRYVAALQEHILAAAAARGATDEQLACADKAARYYTLELPPSIQPRYDAMREARLSAFFQEEARSWLAARGLLHQVPTYREGVSDDVAFTREVERLCGPRATGAFRSSFGVHVLSPEWIKRELAPPGLSDEVFRCLMNVTTVAGFDVGFIGNEHDPSR